MKSRFLLGIEEIGVRYRSHGTNCGAIWFCHIPFCPEGLVCILRQKTGNVYVIISYYFLNFIK